MSVRVTSVMMKWRIKTGETQLLVITTETISAKTPSYPSQEGLRGKTFPPVHNVYSLPA